MADQLQAVAVRNHSPGAAASPSVCVHVSDKKPVNFWGVTGVNLLAWPGLGTLLAGRRISGGIQATMALVGGLLTLCLFIVLFNFAFHGMDSNAPIDPRVFLQQNKSLIIPGTIGFGMLVLAWCWAAVSCYQIAKELKSEAGS
jgi:hypothetical protein